MARRYIQGGDRYAIVRDGKVENVVVWDGQRDWSPPEGTTLVKLDAVAKGARRAGKGYTYDAQAKTFTPPTRRSRVKPPDPLLPALRALESDPSLAEPTRDAIAAVLASIDPTHTGERA